MRIALLLGILAGLTPLLAVGEPPKAGGTAAVILDLEQGSFVGFARWKTPSVVTKEGKIVPFLEPARKNLKEEERKPWPVVAAEPPAKDWASPDFDASRWVRVRGELLVPQGASGYGLAGNTGITIYMPGNPVEWGQFYLRGEFRVEDPAQVRDLKLALRYFGGAAVHVNGRELCRHHLPTGALGPETRAERYPDEAYLRPDGKVYQQKDSKEFADRMGIRVRELPAGGVPIPATMLRKGLNVVAVEVHAAPLAEHMYAYSHLGELMPWPHAGVVDARLTAAFGAGLTANIATPPGVGIWTCQPIETVYAYDRPRPAEEARPIRLVGVGNGTVSGKVVLSSASAIRGLKASVSEIATADGKRRIPAAAVRIRWAERATHPVSSAVHWSGGCCVWFDRLLGEPPAEVPAVVLAPPVYGAAARGAAAVTQAWVTVRLPAETAPGDYRGTLTVEAQGPAPAKFAVPLELKVHDWRLPDHQAFTVHHNLYQSPDTVAQYYKVPLWGDRHFELMGRSLDVLAQAGNKLCVVCLVVNGPALNNTESMVRWVKKLDGSYDHDFTILDRYLDLYAAKCGKPGIIQLNIWETQAKDLAKTLPVTVLDPATGKLEPRPQPPYCSPENEAFWKPVMAELRKRLEKRGWFDVTAVVNASYCLAPPKEFVTLYKNIWSDGKWMNASHANPSSFPAKEGHMPVPYSEWVWGSGELYNPDGSGFYGGRHPFYPRAWKRGNERVELSNPRAGTAIVNALRDQSSLVVYRTVSEAALQGNLRGIGRVGGDFWPLPIGKGGKFLPLCTDYGGCSMPNNVLSMISPGPEGAAFNTRLESFREGVQVAEAIIFLQKAVEAKRVDDRQTKRIAELLDERARYILRARFPHRTCELSMECSNWQERDDKLFALCAEMAKATGAN